MSISSYMTVLNYLVLCMSLRIYESTSLHYLGLQNTLKYIDVELLHVLNSIYVLIS